MKSYKFFLYYYLMEEKFLFYISIPHDLKFMKSENSNLLLFFQALL